MHRITVIGAGIMGSRICRHFLGAGAAVALVDPSPEAREGARASFGDGDAAPLFVASVQDLGGDWQHCDLVIEAVPEVLSLKHRVMAELEAFFAPETVIASNTSGLRTSELTRGMRHPRRFLIAHFFNPADLIPAVEVVPGPDTAPEVVARVAALLEETGKKPACLAADVPGFIANRLQHALMRECFHLLDSGVADAETIDTVTRYSLGVRLALIGPFLQRDLNGLDTHLNIARYLYEDLDARRTPPEVLADKVASGQTGRKAGQGFYDWTPERRAHMARIEALLPQVVALSSGTDAKGVSDTDTKDEEDTTCRNG
ncbi:3-hydroxyacyl-CoA dehydrogenase family protein [Oceanicola sp. S124]|uniref:3-hydroxyacyl-CoA dehydrogenase family protein n=1 Tax=Oceanicola sp. S124 TaxID=1042378 RepID=UPI0002559F42|nr:3-hydroxyacyl-CoA dehydrogenase NAD-binding domain-containing protein [Oceanicola sp. S124]